MEYGSANLGKGRTTSGEDLLEDGLDTWNEASLKLQPHVSRAIRSSGKVSIILELKYLRAMRVLPTAVLYLSKASILHAALTKLAEALKSAIVINYNIESGKRTLPFKWSESTIKSNRKFTKGNT